MEFAIAIPQTYTDPVRIHRFLKRAEELPLVATWYIEQVIGTVPVLESVTTLAYAAAVTKRCSGAFSSSCSSVTPIKLPTFPAVRDCDSKVMRENPYAE